MNATRSSQNSELRTQRCPVHVSSADFHTLLGWFGPSLALWRAAEIAVLRTQRFERPILDLGCGDGLVTSMVLPDVDIGLDPDEQALERAARCGIYRTLECASMGEGASGGAPRLPDGSVATVLSNSVLEHVEPVDAALAAVARVLRPGGRLIFTVPSDRFTRWLLLPSQRYRTRRNAQLVHLNLHPLAWWGAALQRAGLRVEAYQPYLRHELVVLWDALDLTQAVWIGRHRLFSLVWERLPDAALAALAASTARLDLSASGSVGGGQMIVARKEPLPW